MTLCRLLLVSCCLLCLGNAPCNAQSARQTLFFAESPTRVSVPYADTLHALIVFAKFRDDAEPGDPNVFQRAWLLFENPHTLPLFANTLLAPSPDPPFVDSTLTDYFFQQSMGRFVIYGDVYDSVMVSQHPEAAYHRPDGGYGYLTVEILDRLDAAGFDFSRYDHNHDGVLDYLFLVIRRDSQLDAKRITYTGISCLDARCGGGVTAGRPPGRDTLRYDGIRVDWRKSGSIVMHRTAGNIVPHRYHVRMMAHELGHDLWVRFFNHIAAISDNDVPQHSNRTQSGTNAVGYVLMAGAGGGWDTRGDETISAFERDVLGWIDCKNLTEERADIPLADLYTSSDCKTITLGGTEGGRVLYLTNRQRLGPFDVRRDGGLDNRFEMGQLRTTGLLVHLADDLRLDVLPADNTLDLSVRNADYDGDLFGPDTGAQLTPWTRPNIHGYTHYPAGYQPSWQAIDHIRYLPASGGVMAFDYLADFRQHPVIRAESWMGDEIEGYVFEHEVVVTRGTPLHLGTALTFAEGLRLEPDATVIVEAGASVQLTPSSLLRLAQGARVVVEGELQLDGWIQHNPAAHLTTAGRGRIVVRRR